MGGGEIRGVLGVQVGERLDGRMIPRHLANVRSVRKIDHKTLLNARTLR